METHYFGSMNMVRAFAPTLARSGLEAGEVEILAGQETVQVKAALSADPSVLYPRTA
ncbi:MAG TPA: hypothetical protein VE198_16970 [Actinoallomurus sp.]|jgi:hypothetical protein|nr:hypothetical protein [Actinoallomurus sp.]